MERRLSAILAADVVRYSALMEQDEAGTFERLKAHRKELFEPEIEKHHGRVFKLTGDGLFAEFASVVDAVECAVSLQRGLAERNVNVPEDQRINVRVGINLGEVIVEGEDRLGEGVNIAARLEQLAEPGGICVSGKVAKEVEKKLAFGFEPMGEQKVKNIAEPISAFKVKMDALPLRVASTRRPRPERAFATVPSIAVLPLTKMSSDPALEYFADGTTENLITALARSPELRVISRTSSEAYRGKNIDIRQIGRELGAQYILEGSVQKIGEKMRIAAQLIDTSDGSHVWAQRYDQESGDALALQDDVIERIIIALAGDIGLIKKKEYEKAWGKDTGSLGEFDYYLRGHQLFMRFTKHDLERAIQIWSKGLQKYPKSSLLHIKLGYGYFQRVIDGNSSDPQGDFKKADQLGREGLANPAAMPLSIGIGHELMAELAANYTRDFEQALRERELALQVMGSDYVCRVAMSYIPIMAGKPEETIKSLQGMTPQWPVAIWGYANLSWAYFVMKDYEKAIEVAKMSPQPTPMFSLAFLAASYVELGKLDQASAMGKKILEAAPSASLTMFRELHFTSYPGALDRELAALRKAGLPEK